MGELFAVVSGKGGTGKTSLCAALATALAKEGKRILCIDCDVGLRNLDISLGLSECGALSFWDVSEGGYSLEDAFRHPVYPTLAFLTAPMNCPVEKINAAAFGGNAQPGAADVRLRVLGRPRGVDAGFRLTAQFADRLLLVTGAGPAAVRDASRVGDLLELMGKKNIRLIVNRVDKNMLGTVCLTIDDVMDAAGLPLAGIVPEDTHVTLAASFGQSLLRYSPNCKAAKASRRIARRIQGFHEPIALR